MRTRGGSAIGERYDPLSEVPGLGLFETRTQSSLLIPREIAQQLVDLAELLG
jgi:hypothetical protein